MGVRLASGGIADSEGTRVELRVGVRKDASSARRASESRPRRKPWECGGRGRAPVGAEDGAPRSPAPQRASVNPGLSDGSAPPRFWEPRPGLRPLTFPKACRPPERRSPATYGAKPTSRSKSGQTSSNAVSEERATDGADPRVGYAAM